MTVSEVLREANRIADKRLEVFHRAMKSLQEEEQRRMNNMKVSMDKKYRTRDGEKVRLLCVDRKRPYAVVALVGEDEVLETFTAEAQHSSLNMHLNDLVEIPEWDDLEIDEPVMVKTKCVDEWLVTVDDVLLFVKKNGRCVISIEDGEPTIEIYDDYRED